MGGGQKRAKKVSRIIWMAPKPIVWLIVENETPAFQLKCAEYTVNERFLYLVYHQFGLNLAVVIAIIVSYVDVTKFSLPC